MERLTERAFGRRLMPWQVHAADVIGATTDDGSRMLFPYIVVHVPRRAGKTGVTFPSLVHRTMTGEGVWCWYTAQTREAAAKTFRKDWSPMVTRSPLYRSGALKLRRSNGSEEVMLCRGGDVVSSVALFAPGPTALHGSDADAVAVDEGWAFTIAQGSDIESGVQPAQLTRPRRQLLIVSAGGTAESAWLARWMTLATDGTPGVAMIDYGAEPGDDPDDPDVWWRVHPALGHTITEEGIASMRSTLPDHEFRRSVLGVWTPAGDADAVIPPRGWADTGHPDARPGDPVTFGLAVSAAGDAAIGAAGRWVDPDGRERIAVEVVQAAAGTSWVPAEWRAIRARTRGRLLVDPLSPAGPLVEDLRAQRLPVEPMTSGGYILACGALLADVTSGRLAHRRQESLDAAAASVQSRNVGDRWVIDRRSGVGVELLEAVTVAAAGARRPVTAPEVIAG